jgi:AcrR family transcriptional regulator
MVSIEAAGKVFIDKGYLETSLEDIAAAAGMSKGALYYYFPSKVEILYFIISTHGDRVLANLEEELNQVEDGYSKIRCFISRHIRLYIENMDESKIFVNEKNYLSPKYFKIIKEIEKVFSNYLPRSLGLPSDRVTEGVATLIQSFRMITWISHGTTRVVTQRIIRDLSTFSKV